jgi:transcriptional regulator GlxA family with amidase domain
LKDDRFSSVLLVSELLFSDETMDNQLGNIRNWPERARQADGSAAVLAKNCGVSLRTLQRFFPINMGKSPKAWLSEQWMLHANEQLRVEASVKNAAINLGYKHPTHFSRDFKLQCGHCPTAKPSPPQPQRQQMS